MSARHSGGAGGAGAGAIHIKELQPTSGCRPNQIYHLPSFFMVPKRWKVTLECQLEHLNLISSRFMVAVERGSQLTIMDTLNKKRVANWISVASFSSFQSYGEGSDKWIAC